MHVGRAPVPSYNSPPLFFLFLPPVPTMSATAMHALFGHAARAPQRLVKMGERVYAEVSILGLYTISVDVTYMDVEEAAQAQMDAFRAEIAYLEETQPHMLVAARLRRRSNAPQALSSLSHLRTSVY